MLESHYIEGVTVPFFDAQISQIVNSYGIDGGGNAMVVAIENADGDVYRLIRSHGLGAYMHVTQALLGLGFDDVFADEPGENGIDSYFVPTAEVMQSVAMLPPEPEPTDIASDLFTHVAQFEDLPETERESIVLSRVGQGQFRDELIGYWGACAVTGATCIPLLRASHIKPWRDATNEERLDVLNGLLLAPQLDAAFDAGYISFDEHGKIMLSRALSGEWAYQLHIGPKLRLNAKKLTSRHQAYLDHHRKAVFRG